MKGEQRAVLAILFMASVSYFFSLQSIPSLLKSIMSHYEVSHAEASSLMFLAVLPGIFLSIPGGRLIRRHGAKIIGALGLLFALLGSSLSALAPTFHLLAAGRLILGVGGAFFVTSAPSILSEWFKLEKLGFAMGVFNINMPVATILAFNLLGGMELAYGWRMALSVAPLLCLPGLLLFLLVREAGSGEPRPLEGEPPSTALRSGKTWLLGLIWATFNMAAISYTTWGKTIFMEFKGLGPTHSDLLASMLMVGGLMTPLTGYLSDRSGRRRAFMAASCVGLTLSLLAIPPLEGAQLFLATLTMGLSASLLPPTLFAIPRSFLGEGEVGLAFGVLNTMLNVGVFLGPLIIGGVLDLYGGYIGFMVMAVFSLISLFLTLGVSVK